MEEQEKEMKKPLTERVKEETEKSINKILDEGIQPGNLDFLFRVVDIHKDMSNEEYWQTKKEVMKMRYRGYNEGQMGNYGEYGEYSAGGNYGRRRRDSRGRYMARGYDSKYRGEEIMDDMYGNFQEYSESSSQYSRGNYGAKEDTMKSLEYMMQSVVDFVEMLKEEVKSHEEMEIIKKYTRKISEM